jgi:hypothetical protein
MFPSDMVCLRNISVETLHKRDTEDNKNKNNNNNILYKKEANLIKQNYTTEETAAQIIRINFSLALKMRRQKKSRGNLKGSKMSTVRLLCGTYRLSLIEKYYQIGLIYYLMIKKSCILIYVTIPDDSNAGNLTPGKELVFIVQGTEWV